MGTVWIAVDDADTQNGCLTVSQGQGNKKGRTLAGVWQKKGSGTLLVMLYKDAGTPSTECSLSKF